MNNDGEIDGVHDPNDRDTYGLGHYHPCGTTHQAPKTDVFYDGFVDRNRNRRQDSGEGVIVWIERTWLGDSGHATTKLNMNKWQTAKS